MHMRALKAAVVATVIMIGSGVIGAQSASAQVPVAMSVTGYDGWCGSAGAILGRLAMGGSAYGYLPTTTGGSSNCTMWRGAAGNGVKALQMGMNLCYWGNNGTGVLKTRLVVDGSFGKATEDALKAVQRAHGITADGIYGVQSRTNLWFSGLYSKVGSCVGVPGT